MAPPASAKGLGGRAARKWQVAGPMAPHETSDRPPARLRAGRPAAVRRRGLLPTPWKRCPTGTTRTTKPGTNLVDAPVSFPVHRQDIGHNLRAHPITPGVPNTEAVDAHSVTPTTCHNPTPFDQVYEEVPTRRAAVSGW
ncbi:hypothetical protein Cci01nite_82310 [Catellatospora citrea]|uniref:Uncharacterized protein n=1 Tax=Catellatospora citrea TaxID=53366 RepID=A0A8J3P3S9_9ACTN|nr:hypothetical protein Cci01nite_82310 [Catellatospora citrea]